jgi:hypothetical protein
MPAPTNELKLLPRNATAVRQTMLVTGNPVSTRLEAGVGNCFPGLECDLRNLERRFFPFLTVDVLDDQDVVVVSVDLAGAQSAGLSPALVGAYETIAADQTTRGVLWHIDSITSSFPPFPQPTIRLRDLGAGTDRPSDAWTALRLIPENADITLVLVRSPGRRSGGPARVQLSGRRLPYLDANGALAAMFEPGELTQSLCSPWTHDFRDCGCFYWASNHPDIALPAASLSVPAELDVPTPWERAARGAGAIPPSATSDGPPNVEMDHYEINRRWQELDFVVEGRERATPYAEAEVAGRPLADDAQLELHLQYAAGVELAVIHLYLAALFSLQARAGAPASVSSDVAVAEAELRRITFGEMRHLRAVNDVIRGLHRTTRFIPALRVASHLPPIGGKLPRAVRPDRLTREVLQTFIDIEQPSVSVDGLYARILATLPALGPRAHLHERIRSIMADGADHFRTFRFIQEWLAPHEPAQYLRTLNPGPPTKADGAAFQIYSKIGTTYLTMLRALRDAYAVGLPAGAPEINAARVGMLEELEPLCLRLVAAGFLVRFETTDPDFASIDPPSDP